MSVTELQVIMLKKIATSEFTHLNGAEPACATDTQTWADAVIESNEDKGTFTSLMNAGLVKHSGYDTEKTVELSDQGFSVYMQVKGIQNYKTLLLAVNVINNGGHGIWTGSEIAGQYAFDEVKQLTNSTQLINELDMLKHLTILEIFGAIFDKFKAINEALRMKSQAITESSLVEFANE
ncbi:hypothetical protein [Methylomonas sp. AM2-LC]|uniref:hypothetical protein n=1 Tax=Methylomonas sp. AM2-LC TaxID=3153301 RepID=UPI00326421A9